jgi:outer membrane receptor for ferrienterochelin and colicin
MNYKKIIIIAIVLIANIKLTAQQIKGRVVEIQDGKEVSLPGANVVWEGTQIGVTSNSEGFYVINQPQSYPATLVVTYVGYQTYKKEIPEWNHYHIVMKSSVDIDEVKVKGKVNTYEISILDPINVQTISTGELEKAACCNLSESFSTNATVDVTFTDAVSGAKQIQMLGLDGVYTQITQENMPLIRGLTSSYGMSYVPGTWIESIQIIKGTGSVVNGFESFTGQINLEYFKPESAPKLFWNAYTNSEGKLENNLQFAKQNGNWRSNLFTHVSYFDKDIDKNDDGFLDAPKLMQINVLNRWVYEGSDKYRISLTARVLNEDRIGGQLPDLENPYKVEIHNDLIEFATKTGLLQLNDPGKSVGLQTSFRKHNQTFNFGNKNDYTGLQESVTLNLIRQTYIGNTNNVIKYGMSYFADRFTEKMNGTDYNRVDLVSGVFSEYSYKKDDYFTLIAGMRADYHNKFGMQYLPRLNLKYNPTEKTVVRISGGKAFRIANIFVENSNYFASNRNIIVSSDLNPEVAWNYGVNLTHCFYLNGREGTLNFDAYRTDFNNQVVVNIETPGELSFYNLDGESYANSMQADFFYELFDNFDVKMAYKINDVHSTFNRKDKTVPLTPKTRALINMAYATNFDKWKFDVTWNYIGESRIPNHSLIGVQEDVNLVDGELFSAPFYLINAQITKKFRKFDWYLGGENLLSYKQENPILSVDNPYSDIFDASLIYAPVMGRILYFGLRYKIN